MENLLIFWLRYPDYAGAFRLDGDIVVFDLSFHHDTFQVVLTNISGDLNLTDFGCLLVPSSEKTVYRHNFVETKLFLSHYVTSVEEVNDVPFLGNNSGLCHGVEVRLLNQP